ncbi:OsmC family protein [Mesorhizobium sp. J428]|uniref:OsmC family protein n=1 Tax=Mesorhizobium sp. J428 TaxID=2898440 RepID=UPI002150F41B|nr:OsmC family protein [Mesorhizobium sp. J428]MCR5858996.1 OsmC family protein [Mesorhizobium sp. J428]
MLEYRVEAKRVDAHGSMARCKDAEVRLDTDVNDRRDAFNPAEMLLASLAACMIKGIERAAPVLKFHFRGVEVRLHGMRQDAPPRMSEMDYEIVVDTDEDDRRIELLHINVRKYGTIFNTVPPQPVCPAGWSERAELPALQIDCWFTRFDTSSALSTRSE